jgi:amidohydrolase
MLLDLIKEKAQGIENEIKAIRCDIHMHPEVGGEEYRTQKLIIDYLMQIGVDEVKPIANTGVLGLIKGLNPGKCIGLRADIDALPIVELNDAPYKSQTTGKMHACGHDAHTSILLGAANIFCSLRDQLSGSVKLFFQPAEESFGGAERMIAEGCLESPHVDAVIGLHVDSTEEVGVARYQYGVMHGMSSEIKIDIKGKGCHAAHPDDGIDAIVIAAKVIDSIQTIVSRNVSAFDQAVVTIGTIKGGTVENAIAEDVHMDGTIRTLSESVSATVVRRLKEMVPAIAQAFGGQATVTIVPSYIPLNNDDKMVDLFRRCAESFLGKESVRDKKIPSLGVEDFAYFAKARPSCFYNLGVGNNAKGINASGHNGHFDIDMDGLYYGMVLHVLTAFEFLK